MSVRKERINISSCNDRRTPCHASNLADFARAACVLFLSFDHRFFATTKLVGSLIRSSRATGSEQISRLFNEIVCQGRHASGVSE
ncbi:hypothetical protein N8Z80_06210 [Litorivicinus sp.]|nr:hypothetical protein [Litorivicinus sp.]